VGRKSSIVRGPHEVRATIDKLIRKGQLTLAEIRQYVADHHGAENAPSISSIHRYESQYRTLKERAKAHDQIARAFVEEMGEAMDDRKSELMIQLVTTLATDLALLKNGDDAKTTIDDVRKLARAVSEITLASDRTDKRRLAIERRARERLQNEQAKALDAAVKRKGISAETAEEIKKKVLGIQ
jgi:hypothetical protein